MTRAQSMVWYVFGIHSHNYIRYGSTDHEKTNELNVIVMPGFGAIRTL